MKLILDKKTGKMVQADGNEAPPLSNYQMHRFFEMLDKQQPGEISSDIPDYLSPVTGKLVSGKVQRREDLKRNNCFEVDRNYGRKPPKRETLEIKESRELNEKLEAVYSGYKRADDFD